MDLDIQICMKALFVLFCFKRGEGGNQYLSISFREKDLLGDLPTAHQLEVHRDLVRDINPSLQIRIWGWNNEFNLGDTGSPSPSKTSLWTVWPPPGFATVLSDCPSAQLLHQLFFRFQFHPVLNCLSPSFKPVFSTLLIRITNTYGVISASFAVPRT